MCSIASTVYLNVSPGLRQITDCRRLITNYMTNVLSGIFAAIAVK